jgi:hypothetical protein
MAVENEKQYEAMKDKGMSKERAARTPTHPARPSAAARSRDPADRPSKAARPLKRRRPAHARIPVDPSAQTPSCRPSAAEARPSGASPPPPTSLMRAVTCYFASAAFAVVRCSAVQQPTTRRPRPAATRHAKPATV